jgi:hypothetical protein
MMMASLQTSAHFHQNGAVTAITKMARAGFVVMSSRKVKMMDEGQVDRRRLVFLVEKEEDLVRRLLNG